MGRKERPPLRGAKTPAARALPTSAGAPPARLPCNHARPIGLPPLPVCREGGLPSAPSSGAYAPEPTSGVPPSPTATPSDPNTPKPRPCVIASRPSAPPCLGACQRCFPHVGVYSCSPARPQTRALGLCLVCSGHRLWTRQCCECYSLGLCQAPLCRVRVVLVTARTSFGSRHLLDDRSPHIPTDPC